MSGFDFPIRRIGGAVKTGPEKRVVRELPSSSAAWRSCRDGFVPWKMGLRGIYIQPARSVSFVCVFGRSLREGPGANHHSCFRPGFLPSMEDWLDV